MRTGRADIQHISSSIYAIPIQCIWSTIRMFWLFVFYAKTPRSSFSRSYWHDFLSLVDKVSCLRTQDSGNPSVPIGYELLRVLLSPPPGGNFVDYVFHKACHLTSFFKNVSPLAAGAFWCYSVLITLPVIFFKKICNWGCLSSTWTVQIG